MATLLVLTRSEQAKALIQWAARLAEARPGPLMILCCFEGYPVREMTVVKSERLIGGEWFLKMTKSFINELKLSKAELWELRHPDIVGAVVSEIEKHNIDLLIIGTDGRKGRKDREARLGNRMLRFVTSDTMLIDPGKEYDEQVERIIVPMESAFAPAALKAGADMVREGGVVVPLLVGSEFGSDSRAVARRELDLKLNEIETTDIRKFIPEVVIADRPLEGLAKASRNCNMLLIGASTDRVLFKLRSKQAESEGTTQDRDCAIGMFRPAREKGAGLRPEVLRRTLQWLPKLSPTDRINIFDRLQAGARFNPDFLVMMGLSTAIASLGLLQGSSAAIIGAMLVAPLMTPLIGTGFALVQGNIRLFRKSIVAMAMGIVFGLALSLFIALVAPKESLSMEIISRASPDVLDLIVALLSGMAAAYAFARPSLMGTLAGVAIAAALVPPLAVVGISLSRGMLIVAESAAILHFTNLVAITLGAAIIFRLLGIQGVRLGIGPSLWARRALLALILIVVLLLAPLGYKTAEKLEEGQSRPIYLPFSKRLNKHLLNRIEQESGVDLIIGGRLSFIEQGKQTGLVLTSEGPVSPVLKMDLRQIVKERLGADTKVLIYVLLSSPIEQGQEKDRD